LRASSIKINSLEVCGRAEQLFRRGSHLSKKQAEKQQAGTKLLMPRRPPSLPFSLLMLATGAYLVYYVFHAHRADATDMVTIWDHLGMVSRAIAVAGLMASAYGFGGILNRLLLARRR
jgi:hypothetical protein